ncbi:5-oxoprolinase subunit PxpB [Pelistega europaea]|uniref:5-oxoprolinase subunit PxpB n=1 Tax=Pelistega europaea TaxID=106147 RepID=A0A7Y4L936_9BURK|nr:5-oxoprolinase subunit PxpB [Pelistega europaea]NOL49173.1 5-oxoprolinase subunit PxpB [Pelistega europaea]
MAVDNSPPSNLSPYSYHFEYEGDSTLIIRLHQTTGATPDICVNTIAIRIAEYINTKLVPQHQGIIEALPTFTTVGVYYDLDMLGEEAFTKICQQLQPICEQVLASTLKEEQSNSSSQLHNTTPITIPICYEFGEDLAELADTLSLSIEEIIALHSQTPIRVFMLGFSPGMPYLGMFNEKLNVPRRATPRIKLPAGAVAIANRQCVIYPFETPGGWHIVGRAPLKLFNPNKVPHTPYQPGDMIIFKPISKEEYQQIYQQEHNSSTDKDYLLTDSQNDNQPSIASHQNSNDISL